MKYARLVKKYWRINLCMPCIHNNSHMLIAFGGPNGGLQNAIDADEDLQCAGEDANELFDLFIVPSATAGSRTIRTEEGIHMVMTSLQPHIETHGEVNTV